VIFVNGFIEDILDKSYTRWQRHGRPREEQRAII